VVVRAVIRGRVCPSPAEMEPASGHERGKNGASDWKASDAEW